MEQTKTLEVHVYCGKCHSFIGIIPYEWAAGALYDLCAKCAAVHPLTRKRAPWDRRR